MGMDAQGNLFILSNEWPLYSIGAKRRSEMNYAIFRCSPREFFDANICGYSVSRSNPRMIDDIAYKMGRTVDDIEDPLSEF